MRTVSYHWHLSNKLEIPTQFSLWITASMFNDLILEQWNNEIPLLPYYQLTCLSKVKFENTSIHHQTEPSINLFNTYRAWNTFEDKRQVFMHSTISVKTTIFIHHTFISLFSVLLLRVDTFLPTWREKTGENGHMTVLENQVWAQGCKISDKRIFSPVQRQ